MPAFSIIFIPSKRFVCLFANTLGITIFWLFVCSWYRNWGSTPGEAASPRSGDELHPSASWLTTHAITIYAPVDQVWPWVVQIRRGRGVFYSYDWLENLFALDIHDMNRILPELQQLNPTDPLSTWHGVGQSLREAVFYRGKSHAVGNQKMRGKSYIGIRKSCLTAGDY
jgi:hypothetical protein